MSASRLHSRPCRRVRAVSHNWIAPAWQGGNLRQGNDAGVGISIPYAEPFLKLRVLPPWRLNWGSCVSSGEKGLNEWKDSGGIGER